VIRRQQTHAHGERQQPKLQGGAAGWSAAQKVGLRSGSACLYAGEPVYRAVRDWPRAPGVNRPIGTQRARVASSSRASGALGSWPSFLLARCAGWRLSGDVAVPDCLSAPTSSATRSARCSSAGLPFSGVAGCLFGDRVQARSWL